MIELCGMLELIMMNLLFVNVENLRRAVRFLTAHLINLVNELVLLEIWLWAGVPKLYAPLCVFLVAFPVNFLMVRFALRGRLKS